MPTGSVFRLLLGARLLSTLCTGLDTVVLAWLVLSVGGRPLDLAVMAALNAAAGIPASFFGGPLIDRISRRAVSVATEVGRILPLTAIPLLAAVGELHTWEILVVTAVVSGLYSLSSASYSALLPELFDRTALLRANGMWQAASQVGVFIGAALGGTAIPILGETNPLLLGIAGRIGTGVMLLMLRMPATAGPEQPRTSGLLFRDMTDAWRFLLGRRVLLWATLLAAVPGSLISAINAVLPAFVRDDNHLGASEYGLVDAAWGVGAFVVSLLFIKFLRLSDERRRLSGSLMLMGAAMMLMAAAQNLFWLLVLAGMAGGTTLGCLVIFRAYIQAWSPPAYTGRILAVSQVALSGLWLGVAFCLGLLTLALPVRFVIVTWGAAMVLVGATAVVLLGGRGAAGLHPHDSDVDRLKPTT